MGKNIFLSLFFLLLAGYIPGVAMPLLTGTEKGALFPGKKNTAQRATGSGKKVLSGNQKKGSVGPDLRIKKTANKFFYDFGESVTFTIKVYNEGTTLERNVFVEDALPTGLSYLGASPGYDRAAERWIINALAIGDSATFTIFARTTKGGQITNVAYANLDGSIDATPANNSSPATICVRPPDPGIIKGPLNLCIKDSSTYSVTNVPGVGFTWFVPPTWTIISGQGSNAILLKPGNDTLTAYVYVRGSTTCGTSTLDSLKVIATRKPDSLSVITGDTVVCENAIGKVYSVTENSNVEDYTWKVPAGWVITAGQGTHAITVNTSATGGVISVEGANICGLSPKSELPVKSVKLPLTLGNIIPPFAGDPCVGQDSLVYTVLAATDVTQYNWTVPTGWTIVSGQGTDSITVFAGTTGGLISVVGENNCGEGPVSSLQVTPATKAPDQPAVISGDIFPCINQTGVIYSVAAQAGVNKYNWTVPGDWTIVAGQNTNQITVNVGSLADSIKVTAANGCGTSITSALAVTPQTGVPPAPVAIITGPGGSPCVGQVNFVYSVAAVGGASGYTWSLPNGWTIASGQGTNAITVLAGSNGGLVSVTADNGCGSSPAVSVPVLPVASPPAAPIAILGDPVPCVGNTNNIYSVPVIPGAVSYTWTVPASWTINAGQGKDSIDVTPGTTGGVISVIAENSCGSSTAISMVVNSATAEPARPGAINGNANVCLNQNGLTYSVAAVPFASAYYWTVPQGWTINSGQGTNSISVRNITSGGTISVTAVNGCGSSLDTTLTVTMSTVAPGPAKPITGSINPCIGQTSAVYSTQPVQGASSYNWTVPNGWQIISGRGTDNITVTIGAQSGNVSVAPVNGCGSGAFSTLVVTPSNRTVPVVGPVSGSGVPCIGQTKVKYQVAAIPGVSVYNWILPQGWIITKGSGTNSIEVEVGNTSGQVEVTAANNCGTSLPVNIPVNPASSAPDSSGRISGLAGPCLGRTITYVTSGASRTDTYTWTVPPGWNILSGQGNDTVTVRAGSAAGNITVIASNGCGAAPAATFAVTPNTTPPVLTGLISGRDRVCEGEEDLTYSIASVSGASSYNWTVPNSWQIISGQGTTSIVVKAGDTNGNIMVDALNDCGRSATVIFVVNVRTLPVITGKMKIENLTCTSRSYSVTPVAEATSYFWTVPKGWAITKGQGTPAIQVTVSADTGSVAVAVQNDGCSGKPLKLKVSGDITLDVPNAFSPNNDGINDVWEIPELDNYPDNEVTVINRWGNEVFRTKNYQQNWNGKDLAAGTYYYILRVKLCNEVEKTFKGFVMIAR
ncbi:T9SS type B sorting domain-containing protein [Adhaeribacter soli]|uniref:T9SS type B sorting domain-containing protein n=1 Tax=Adhaeribacter soli TaxID=2607655 RepID=A0A5N1J175_9BACT|nr:gliding motility-associated C-terminal domain-containing protein [Adhaeribacter soli]KAA9340158.1 T9SS type B sorting domain-containing protein [Adhaeribacter soli]